MAFHRLFVCSFTILMTAFLICTGVDMTRAQDRSDDRRGSGMHGGSMRGVGIGTGIGIGIGLGVGRAISEQPAVQSGPEPVRRSSAKKRSKKPEPEPSLTFAGKPADVAYNPSHREGEMGKLSEHKSVLVVRDGAYLRRGYYSASKDGDVKWLWYELPLAKEDPVITKLPYAASCAKDSDTCTVITRDIPPLALSITDVFGDWWSGYKPVKVVPRCDAVTRPVPGSIPVKTIASCTNVVGSCSGSCELYDAAGANQGASPPATLNVAAGAPSVSGVYCKCAQ